MKRLHRVDDSKYRYFYLKIYFEPQAYHSL